MPPAALCMRWTPCDSGGYANEPAILTHTCMAQVLEPVIAAYAPDLIIVSAGYDAVMGDPLGGMALSPELYGHLTERMARLAQGKLVLALEGGGSPAPPSSYLPVELLPAESCLAALSTVWSLQCQQQVMARPALLGVQY